MRGELIIISLAVNFWFLKLIRGPQPINKSLLRQGTDRESHSSIRYQTIRRLILPKGLSTGAQLIFLSPSRPISAIFFVGTNERITIICKVLYVAAAKLF